MKSPKAILHQIAVDAWEAGIVVCIACLVLETAEPGFVSRFFNMLWLLLFLIVASGAVLLAQSRSALLEEPHHSAPSARILLRLGMLLLAPAAWMFFPADARLFWRAAAVGGILLAVLIAWPIFSKKE